MKILVSGANGFVGEALAFCLAKQGDQLICLGHKNGRSPHKLFLQNNIDFRMIGSADFGELSDTLNDLKADIVINLASYGVDPRQRDLDQLLAGNVNILVNLLKIASQWNIHRFIHLGSCFEFRPNSEKDFLDDDDPLSPFSLYGASKLAASVLGSFIAKELDVPFLVLRSFGIYGIGESPDRLLPYVISKLSLDEEVDLTMGEQVRDYLYISDVVSAIAAVSRSTIHRDLDHLNVCSAKPVTIRTLCEIAADQMNKPRCLLRWGKREYRQEEPLRIVGNNKKLIDLTGWKPKITFAEGIRQMVAHYAATDEKIKKTT